MCRATNLENRLSIRPDGVVSKKVIGDLKMAYAILSCSLRDAYTTFPTSKQVLI